MSYPRSQSAPQDGITSHGNTRVHNPGLFRRPWPTEAKRALPLNDVNEASTSYGQR